MRTRNVKPAFFHNEVLADLSPLTRLLFIGLWCLADREGRLEDRPRRIKAAILPFDECSVNDALNNLHETGFIVRYEIDGQPLIQIANFVKHQYPHKTERPSILPSITEQERKSNGTNPPVLPIILPPFHPLAADAEKGKRKQSTNPPESVKPEQAFPPEIDVPAFHSAWSEWIAFRKERKPAVTPRSAAMAFKLLRGIGAERAIRAIEFSIANGYQGIVEPRDNAYGRANQTPKPGRIETPAGKYDGVRSIKVGGEPDP